MEAKFQMGQMVCLQAESKRQGSVIQVLPSAGGRPRYKVFHSARETRDYYEEQLQAFETSATFDNIIQAIRDGHWLTPEEFRARLTAARLAHPLTDNLYALHAARIKFIPFQFKPLLRLLRSDRPRLLIADEVGVGKTIEAGLILKEIQSRQKVENVLIVCPKALVTKWRAEMRRFDETFHALDASTLRYCLKQTHLEGVWPSQYSRAIVHLELFRNPDYLFGTVGRGARPGLATLDPPPQFSLSIFDEAHHLRNPDTNGNQLARFICDTSEAALFLSATPVQLGSRNLYTLLNLLRPDLFIDEKVFNEMVAPNMHLTQAMRHVRTRAPKATWQTDSAQALLAAVTTTWGQQVLQQDPRFSDWFGKLQAGQLNTDEERVRCLRDLEEVHTLAHVMNRTRRRDIGRFTTREPRKVSVPFTTAQQEFYQTLIQFRAQVLLLNYDPLVVRLIIDMLERQAASCLPALLPTLDHFLRTGRFSVSQFSDDIDEDDEIELPPALRKQAETLRVQAAKLPDEDPKLDQLLALAKTSHEGDGPGKMLVFSFFLHTLNYLRRHLERAGFRVGLVTGQIEEEEREMLRDRFRKPRTDADALDILFSSEVGCEGLDYEFCDRLVNYDIPWNPMRLEQRIGRIDRFGQISDKVLIFNFVTPGTVEERIFFRCFDRLGIFRDTVGDCEEVLGELAVAEELLKLARDPRLTPEQAEARAQQIADNAVRALEEQRRLEAEGGNLLGLDQALTNEVEAMSNEGKFVSPQELRAMISQFVERPNLAGKIETVSEQPMLYRLRLNQSARQQLARQVRDFEQPDRAAHTFRRWLEGAEPYLLLTFDQATALEKRDVPFVTPVHPLARLSIATFHSSDDPLTAYLTVNDANIISGRYLFVCDLWETIAAKQELRLVNLAWHLGENRQAPEVAAVLLRLLSQPKAFSSPTPLPSDTLEKAITELDEEAHRQRETALQELRSRNETLITRKLASLDAYHRSRLKRIELELASNTDERIRIMKTAERNRAESDYEGKRQAIESRRSADILSQRIAAGILEVSNE